MKQQFFVGDSVRICDTPQEDTYVLWDDWMGRFCGAVGEVVEIHQDNIGAEFYSVKTDNEVWGYDTKWLTIVERKWQKNTGEQPVDSGVYVEYKQRDMVWQAERAGNLLWKETISRPITEWRIADNSCSSLEQPEAIPPSHVALGDESVSTDVSTGQEWTDKHYDNNYTLTQKDIERGFVKIDPYRVSKQWRLGSKDESGVLFHILKTVARYGEKNSREREVKALYAQIKCLAEIEGVNLDA